MATDKVVKALVDLAESMRVEDLARLTYSGTKFEIEASKLIRNREEKRVAFEIELNKFVGKLVRA